MYAWLLYAISLFMLAGKGLGWFQIFLCYDQSKHKLLFAINKYILSNTINFVINKKGSTHAIKQKKILYGNTIWLTSAILGRWDFYHHFTEEDTINKILVFLACVFSLAGCLFFSLRMGVCTNQWFFFFLVKI